MEVSVDEVGKVLAVVVVKGIVLEFGIFFGLLPVGFRTGSMLVVSRLASCSPMGVMWCRLAVELDLVPV